MILNYPYNHIYLKPCPRCNNRENFKITDKKKFDKEIKDFGVSYIIIRCTDCDFTKINCKSKNKKYRVRLNQAVDAWNNLERPYYKEYKK